MDRKKAIKLACTWRAWNKILNSGLKLDFKPLSKAHLEASKFLSNPQSNKENKFTPSSPNLNKA